MPIGLRPLLDFNGETAQSTVQIDSKWRTLPVGKGAILTLSRHFFCVKFIDDFSLSCSVM